MPAQLVPKPDPAPAKVSFSTVHTVSWASGVPQQRAGPGLWALCEQGWQSHVVACGSHPFLPLQPLAPGSPALRELVSMQLSHDTENQSALGALPRHQQALNPALVAVVQKEVEGSLEDPNKS